MIDQNLKAEKNEEKKNLCICLIAFFSLCQGGGRFRDMQNYHCI